MRYSEIAVPQRPARYEEMQKVMTAVRTTNAAGIWPEISPWRDDCRNLAHEVECPGLTVGDFGEAFAEEFQGRRLWCRQTCKGIFNVEPIRDVRSGHDTGRRFRFADGEDAARFRLKWC